MTSATAFAPLLAPVLDDSMEVSSSPAGNQYDDEVLIDYDDYGTATFNEDERMIEDGEQTRPGTATDDMMEDAEFHTAVIVNEETMHDDPVAVVADSYIEDEELIDYSDDEYQDDTQITLDDSTVQIPSVPESSSRVPTPNVIESENVDEAVVQQPQDFVTVEDSTTYPLSAVAEDNAHIASTDEVTVAAVALDDQTANVEQDDTAEELSHQADAEAAESLELGTQAFEGGEPDGRAIEPSDDQKVHDGTEVLKDPPKYPAGLDTTAYIAPDGPQTPSDTGIHPTTVRYGDSLMPLFKSRAQPDGLLKDDNLASVSLGDLLDSCRHRLALKIGESISADQELVLSFENMGLQLVEHSPHAFETSLDDVLAVYLNLHQNDSTHPIPPLALSLSLQLKFTSSFNILKAAAQQGEGMSKFAYLRSGGEELDEYEVQEEEEGGEEQGDVQDEEYVHHKDYHDNEAANEEQDYEREDDLTKSHADEDVSHLEEGQEFEEGQHPENQEETQEYAAHQDGTSYQEYEEQLQADVLLGERADVHDEYADGDTHENEAEQDYAQIAPGSKGHIRPASAASSRTVRGDLTNDSAGEYYSEDFIDFGDDSLTTDTAELLVDDGKDNSSTLVSEHDGEEAADGEVDAAAVDDDQNLDDTTNAGDFRNQHSDNGLDGEVAEVGNALFEIDDEADDEADNDFEQHRQGEDVAVDELDPNEEDLPAEADGQFDAAFDLLEGHDFEDVAQNGEPPQPDDGLEYDDDDIGFNDDVEEAILASNSPLGKRSFDEHIGENGVAEEQESKKVRS